MYLGIDGGGSKTAAVLLSPDGETLGAARGPGSAIVGAPSPERLDVLRRLVGDVLRQAGRDLEDVTCTGIGLNGIDFEDEFEAQIGGLSSALGIPRERMALVNDAIAALWGGTNAPAAVMVQHGSGATTALRSKLGAEVLYDHLDAGKLFDMRGELLHVVARMIDGRLESTPLKKEALDHYGIRDEAEFAERHFRRKIGWDRISTSILVVYRAWEKGDPAAGALVGGAAADYAATAAAMIRRTGSADADAVFGGGVIMKAPAKFWDLLSAELGERSPRARVKRPGMPAEYGAAVMAAHWAGEDAPALFKKADEKRPRQP